MSLFKEIQTHPLIVIAKARQLGITWAMSHVALWRAIFFPGANVVILSKGEKEAAENVAYCRFIHSHLPDYLAPQLDRNRLGLLSFPSLDSKIMALPATEDAGIGFGGASLVILDEADFHPYADKNFSELKPMIDAGEGRQMIMLSARNANEEDTKFKQVLRQALAKENNFYPIFIPYNAMPYRDKKWYNAQKADYEPWELEARYPATVKEFLAPSQILCFFDEPTIDLMIKQDVMRMPVANLRNGTVQVWKESVLGRKYCMAIDPADGYDPYAIGVMDWQSGELVATAHGKAYADQIATIGMELYEMYHSPFLAVERNGCGVNVIDKMRSAGVTTWFQDKPGSGRLGWFMNVGNRRPALDALKEAVYKRQIRIYCEEVLREMLSFIQEPGKEPRAPKSAHDDYVMMLAVLWAIRKVMPAAGWSIQSTVYKG